MTTGLRVCLISSHGGHLRELLQATQGIPGDAYFVTCRTKHTVAVLAGRRRYFVVDPHVSWAKYALNGLQSLWHVARERPDVVVTTGAGIAIPTVLLCRLLLRSRLVFVESAANVVTPSRTGRFLYRFADLFVVQWPGLLEHYPGAVYGGLA